MVRRTLPTLVLAAITAVGLAQPAHAGTSGVLFGASVAPKKGETFAQAVARQDAAFGRMPISRVFNSGATAWPGAAGVSRRPVVVSFKYPPADVLAGRDDAALNRFFTTAPTTYDVYWSYVHEPEDNIERGEFTATAYKLAWKHITALPAAARNRRLHSTLILQCFTMNSASGRNWLHYYAGVAVQSMIAFDCYNHAGKHNAYGDPGTIFGPVTTWASGAGSGITWGIAEVGSTRVASDPSGSQRAAWLRSVGTFLAGQHRARSRAAIFGIYFDVVGPSGTDYRLTDTNSRTAWANVVQNY